MAQDDPEGKEAGVTCRRFHGSWGLPNPPTALAEGSVLCPKTLAAIVGLPRPPKAPEPRAPKEEKGGERTYGSRCAAGRKEWGVDGDMNGVEDGLTPPAAANRLPGLVRS